MLDALVLTPSPPTGHTRASSLGDPIGARLEEHRVDLTAYCYRMLGSAHEAEDAVQDTLLRAWRGFSKFEGRSGMRTWLYKIATNVCFDVLQGRRRRGMPMDVASPASRPFDLGSSQSEEAWISPIPTRSIVAAERDIADDVVARDSIRLAFVAALQHLTPRQRAALILCDVLAWKATEAAALLDLTDVAVESSLRRARASMATRTPQPVAPMLQADAEQLVAQYVDAFRRFDIEAIVSLLRDDAILSMPPFELWIRGRDNLRHWFQHEAATCSDSRIIPVDANGSPALAVYHSATHGIHEAFAIQVLELSPDGVVAVHAFIDPTLFELFGQPLTLAS